MSADAPVQPRALARGDAFVLAKEGFGVVLSVNHVHGTALVETWNGVRGTAAVAVIQAGRELLKPYECNRWTLLREAIQAARERRH